ncbi:hypothetical protein [Alkalihalobacterium alkalinitrilicum]|uniref:hypothetical protein n=1 Tax=Alkalihalobacterium alkalinitrilicum TaxID=427920 RepID=UPI00114DD115|nr:hypothetical protein [Alkalihalobacterium alkalinitrilicum]
MVIVLPFILIIFGFTFAFIGGSITNNMNHVPFYQVVDEIVNYVQLIISGTGQAYTVFSFDLIHDFIIPGFLYFLATACMISACKMIYLQLETEKLEESFLRIAIMTVVGLMTVVLIYKGGATLLIISVSFVFFMNIYQWGKYLFIKRVHG